MRGVVTTFSVEEELKRQPLINADLYEKASNWGQKSDILRMELLLRYGGVRPSAPAPTSPFRADVGAECFKVSFDAERKRARVQSS